MSLYYVKGTPGSGKSTICEHLRKLGYEAHDADDEDMGGPFNKASNQLVTYPDSPTKDWFDAHSWRLIPEAIKKLHQKAKTKTIFLCGTAANEDKLWEYFDQVIFLDIDKETLMDRVINRTNNEFGQAKHEQDLILEKYHADRKKRDRQGVLIVDATQPIQKVINNILKIQSKINP